MHKLIFTIRYLLGRITEEELLEIEFKKKYKHFIYPFITADIAIKRMNQTDKTKYYKAAVEIRDNSIIKQELNEVARQLYYELAVEPKGNMKPFIKASYKGALLFANKFYSRFQTLALRDPAERQKAVDDANDAIEEIIGN